LFGVDAAPKSKTQAVRFFPLLLIALISCQNKFDKEETHKHAPIFNGMVRSTPEHKHIELYIARSGAVEVYLFDEAQDILETQGATGTIEITFEDGHQEKFPLSSSAPDNHPLLAAQINKPFPNPVTAFVDASQNGVRYQAKFHYDLNQYPDKVPHMHDSRQGGLVAMIGEQHVELVWMGPGEYRVYLSDMKRGPLSPSIAKDPSLIIAPDSDSPETLPLSIDPTQTFLQASGAKISASTLPVEVVLTLGGKPGAIDFLLVSKK
jgi:hypothetical protein